MKHPGLVICIVFLLGACTGNQSPPGNMVTAGGEGSFTRYASGFSIYERDAYTLVEVRDPWQQSRNVIFSYVLAPDREAVPDSLLTPAFIKTPVRKVIALSTTHVAMIEQLGSEESIVGISGAAYMYSEFIRDGIESRRIKDVGYGQGLDYETIVRLEPDVVFLYGVEGNVMTSFLRDAATDEFLCADCHGHDSLFRYKYFHWPKSRELARPRRPE